MPAPRVITPPHVANQFYHLAGLALLMLCKARTTLKGYKNPRPFSIHEYKRAIEYDFSVVNHWLKALSTYQASEPNLENKSILELGPGADLGIGLTLLMKGARKYNALDVNDLVNSCPRDFYREFFAELEKQVHDGKRSLDFLQKQLDKFLQKDNDLLNYICNKVFDVSIFKDEGIDLIFSQAAFEHFDEIEKTFSDLSSITKTGAVLVAEIDLKTHTRYIRDQDPLSIYRYSDLLYRLCKYPGQPNRRRPFKYIEILRSCGWTRIETYPLVKLDENYLSRVKGSLDRQFMDERNQMDWLSMMVCATKL